MYTGATWKHIIIITMIALVILSIPAYAYTQHNPVWYTRPRALTRVLDNGISAVILEGNLYVIHDTYDPSTSYNEIGVTVHSLADGSLQDSTVYTYTGQGDFYGSDIMTLNGRIFIAGTIVDSHASMVNIDPFKLDARASLIRGYPRPMSMIIGSQEADAALFLGYHASPQHGGVLGHTYAGRVIQRVRVPGSDMATEYLLNTYALGEMGKPVILVAGDESLREQVEEFTPWAKFVALKKPIAFFADYTKPFKQVEEALRRGVREAVRTLSSGEAKPLKAREPWIEVEFKRPYHAEIAELFPCVERLDGVTVRLTCEKYLVNFKMLEGLVIAAYSFER